MLGPVHGTTTLDTPSLMPGIGTVIAEASIEHPVIVDVGGDADGARALARFVPQIEAKPDTMLIYVVNQARPETATPDQALAILREIEKTSGINATHIAGNTHLKEQTTTDTVVASLPYVQSLSQAANLPVAFVTAPRSCVADVEAIVAASLLPLYILPVDIIVGNPWEDTVPFASQN